MKRRRWKFTFYLRKEKGPIKRNEFMHHIAEVKSQDTNSKLIGKDGDIY